MNSKIPDNLVFLQAVSHDPYMQWQIEVQIVNFRKFGISDRMQICVWHRPTNEFSEDWKAIQKKYPEVKIYMYEDQGVNLGLYLSQLRPHILKRHFHKYEKELKGKVFFYHDQDIIFNYLPDFEKLCADDINWQSNCSHYLDYKYLYRKEIEGNIPRRSAICKLASIGKVDIKTIFSYRNKTGGAQCLFKDIDWKFWADVEKQCLEIRREFWFSILTSINRKYFKSENQGFQSWCADMWAVNMALWNRGKVTDVTKELDFSWATDTTEIFEKKPIYHNAGSTGPSEYIFHKASYINHSPLYINVPLPKEKLNPANGKLETSASIEYVLAINEVKK